MPSLLYMLGDILSRVEVLDTGCWNCNGNIRKDGYIQYGYSDETGRRYYTAHAIVYAALNGVLIRGLVVDHLCFNRTCVNPGHLEQTSRRENFARGQDRYYAMQTHCPKGHEYNIENTYLHRGRYKRCRACTRERMAEMRSNNPNIYKEDWAREKAKRAEYQMWIDKANAIINRK